MYHLCLLSIGTLSCTYRYYLSGNSVVEEENGSNQSIKDHVWGLSYIDEAVQTRINTNPTGTASWSSYWLMQDANYNVLGIVNSSGVLQERYEYTPYGQRQVFASAGSNDPGCYAPLPMSTRVVTSGSVTQPYGLCEIGHQGLMHDEQSGLVNNRARILQPTIGRFLQEDPLGYVDGPNDYQMEGDNPIRFIDASGSRLKSGTLGDRNADHIGFSALWGQEFEARIVSKSFINGVPLGTSGSVGPDAAGFEAFARFTDLSFRENPLTDAKDTHYRLYAKLTFHFFCDCMDRIHLKGPDPDGAPDVDMDRGYEAGGLLQGTINVDKPKITRFGDETLGFAYRVWGHPNALLEPSFQYFSFRTSVNIWHTSAGTIHCKNGKGHITTHSLQGSSFPSHKDWIMGDLIHTLSQGKFSSLWDADPDDPSFVY